MDINKIKNLLQSISHWPWKSSFQCNNSWLVYGPKIPYEGSDGFLEEDAVFIASAPTIIDQLIRQNEVMREALTICAMNPSTNLTWTSPEQIIEGVHKVNDTAIKALKEVERIEDEQ